MEISSLGNSSAGQPLTSEANANNSSKNTSFSPQSLETQNAVSDESQASLIPPPEPTGELESEGTTIQSGESQTGGQVDFTV